MAEAVIMTIFLRIGHEASAQYDQDAVTRERAPPIGAYIIG